MKCRPEYGVTYLDKNETDSDQIDGHFTIYRFHLNDPITFEKSLQCLKTRGMMVSFGNASGSLSPIDVTKMLQPKGLFFVRPSMGQYLTTSEELNEASKVLFEKISSGKVKVEIFKKYKLDDIQQAHIDLEARKITGPAVIVP